MINFDAIFQNHINEFNKYIEKNKIDLKNEYNEHVLDMWEKNKELSEEQFKDLISEEKKEFYFEVFRDYTKEALPKTRPFNYENINYNNLKNSFEDFIDLESL